MIRLHDGPVLTLPVLTVADCARSLPLEWGLAVADAAISQSWVKLVDLAPAVQLLPVQGFTGPRGARHARWVLDQARAGAESVLESLARAVVIMGGFPEPATQRWLNTRAGRFRVDLFDEENKVIIEADGKIKYNSREVIWQEKRREDALRDLGLEMVRFAMADYFHPAQWWASYARAHDRGRRSSR